MAIFYPGIAIFLRIRIDLKCGWLGLSYLTSSAFTLYYFTQNEIAVREIRILPLNIEI